MAYGDLVAQEASFSILERIEWAATVQPHPGRRDFY